ncbi:MAG: AAA family ATPase [Candidatus Xenobia bacterium]
MQILTGPRQVGKTTLLLELAREFGSQAIYGAADAPEAALPGWWARQWESAVRLSRGAVSLLLLDEVQYLPDWSRLLKAEADQLNRERNPVHVVVSGSAALRLGAGSRESMAGRFERLTLTHWSAADLGRAFGLSQDETVATVVRQGAFP